MLTEETNREDNTDPTNSRGGSGQRGVTTRGGWQRNLARSFSDGFRQSATAAET